MSKRRPILLPLTLGLVAVFGLACGLVTQKISEKVSEKAGEVIAEEVIEQSVEADGGGNAQVDLSNGQINIQTDKGQVNISSGGASGTLPAEFPGDVPLYPAAKIAGSMNTATPDGASVMVNFETTDSTDKIAAFYKEKLVGSFKMTAEMNMGGQVTLAFVSADEKRTVSLTASPNGTGSTGMLVTTSK